MAIVSAGCSKGTRGRLTNAERASTASEPRDRSAPTKRRARARVGESEGRSPSDEISQAISQMPSERGPRASHAIGARRRSGARERVSGSPRGEAPRKRLMKLLVKGGRVVDPATGRDGEFD